MTSRGTSRLAAEQELVGGAWSHEVRSVQCRDPR